MCRPTAPFGASRKKDASRRATWELRFYELALKVSGAVQARRWTTLPGGGFIHSFNGAHSLFVDTIRSLRSLALGHALGQPLMDEQDAEVTLLERLLQHARATAQFSVLLRTRTCDRYERAGAHGARESFQRRERHLPRPEHAAGLLAVHDMDARSGVGHAGLHRRRSNSSTTLAAAVLRTVRRTRRHRCDPDRSRARDVRSLHRRRDCRGRRAVLGRRRAGGLAALGALERARPADPFNDREPVDSSAAAIAAQGLLHEAFARRSRQRGQDADARPLRAGGPARAATRPLRRSQDRIWQWISRHTEGLLPHSVYHIGRTAGTSCRTGAPTSLAANRVSGATTTRAKRRFKSSSKSWLKAAAT